MAGDLSVSHNKIGLVHEGEGDRETARAAFQVALAAIEPLAVRDPSNATWRNDLAWIRGKLAA